MSVKIPSKDAIGPATAPYAVVVAVGPNATEVQRLSDLADSIAAYEPHGGTLVIVDDAPEARNLAATIRRPGVLDAVDVTRVRLQRGRIYNAGRGICSLIMAGLKVAQTQTGARFVLKLDTDSLIISDFRSRLLARFAENPNIGMIGAYRRSPSGGARDWSMHRRPIRDLKLPTVFMGANQPPPPSLRHVRAVLKAAERNGYTPGEHCLGGGYALSKAAVDRLATRTWLDQPSLWEAIDLPEDVVVGLHVRASGLGFADDVDVGDVFGVCHKGLPCSPEELVARKYGVTHAVKNDKRFSEAEIRHFFASRRLSSSPPQTVSPTL